MKIIHHDKKEGEIKIAADCLEDLWHISKVLSAGDEVEGSTFRTYKIGKTEEKKHVRIRVKVKQVEFAEDANRLRVLGIIIKGEPEEYVQLGRHHALDIAPGDKITIRKKWMAHEIKRLAEAEKETKKPKVTVVVLDEEHALFAVLKPYGIEYGLELRNPARKKSDEFERKEQEYFSKIAEQLERADGKLIVAGPGFAKDNLKGFIRQKNPELLKRIIFESCSYAEPSGVNELVNRGVLQKAAGLARFEKEAKEMEEFFAHIYKESGKAVYGLEEVRKAVGMGAVEKLLVLDELFRKREEAQKIVETAETMGSEIVVISNEGDPGLKLRNFGGIGAILRWKM